MSRFDRYLLSQLMVLFGFFSLVLILVYWVNRAVILFDRLIGDGQSTWVFLEFTALSLPGIIRLVLPIAAAVAAIYVTNRMSVESELTVVQATGFSGFRLARSYVVFGVIVAVLMSILAHYLVPLSNKVYTERYREVSQNLIARLLSAGEFLNPTEGVTFYIRDITPQDELLDVFLSDTRNPKESVTYMASRAFVVNAEAGPQLVMIEGTAQTLRHPSQRLIVTRFDDFSYDISDFIETDATISRAPRELPTWFLLSPSEEIIAETAQDRATLVATAHQRIAEALLPIVAVLIGFSTLVLGGFSRFGVWRQILIAVLLMIAVKVVETAFVSAIRATPSLWPLSYVTLVVGLSISWFQLFWAGRPYLFRRYRPFAPVEGDTA
ncbi:LPS export ABC transporter permease LptF [Loktanella sp. IMCC34160]|uniref:LPS export ABC transporter permease LptF n=1 Tax=Loktanella sp. IMCC34160 TaxID=2510646 RepID=UPI001F5E14A6|nr:LPS export ABC transporter permease LptF [Loktanella sp. IMCC34160]